jgi:2-dehydropantoate 2-reductase
MRENTKMNIGIVGGGSIGLLFGAYLSKMNHSVTLYTRTEEQAISLNEQGLVLQSEEKQSHLSINASWTEKGLCEHDIVVIAVKQYHLAHLLHLLHSIPTSTHLLFIQNGMGHINLIKQLPHNNILVGVVEHGALKENSFTVNHSGSGVTKISLYKGDEAVINDFASNCTSPLFPFQVCENWYEMLIAKLVVNSMINPLTTVLRVENGKLISNPYFYQLLNQLYEEIVLVLQPDVPGDWWNMVVSICEKTACNRSSMLRDLELSKPTEIEGIVGFLRSLPTYCSENTPLLNFLYDAIKGLEK